MNILKDTQAASIVPLAIALIIIIFAGFIIGILTLFINAVSNTDTDINTLMLAFWGFVSVIVLLVSIYWALAKAQRSY